jgi:hypothetical protein
VDAGAQPDGDPIEVDAGAQPDAEPLAPTSPADRP